MPVIKNNQAAQVTRDAVVLDLSDLHRQADRILEQARTQAAAIVTDAQQQAAAMIEDASAKGYQEGFAKGVEEGRKTGEQQAREEIIDEFKPRLQKLADAWERQLEDWNQTRIDLITRAGTDVLTFAFALGERIVHRMIEIDPTIIEAQLADALTCVAEPTSMVIEINPEDREIIERVLPKLVQRLGESAHATLRDDATIMRGGCRISMAGGAIDATIERQLDRMAEVLLPDGRRMLPCDLATDVVADEADPSGDDQ